ncbi:MAG: DMT family transporter [Rhizobiales bacterium]|nr:DMT family transporter [Hyphomicrobiales bacterium]
MQAVLLGVVAAVCWSVHDLITRSVAAHLGPFRLAGLVMVLGFVLLTGVILWNGTIAQASGTGIGLALLMGLAYGFGAAGLFKAFAMAPISVVAPITATYPVLIVLWGVTQGLVPTAPQWALVAATVGGAAIVGRTGSANGGIRLVEPAAIPALIGYCLLACVGYGASVVLGQDAAIAIGETEAAWISRPTALLVLVPFVLRDKSGGLIEPRHWLAMLAMAALDVGGVVAVNASGLLPGREFAAVGISAYGAMAVILGMAVLGEKVSLGQGAGIGLIVLGVAGLAATG